MECYSEQTYSIFLDGELAGDEEQALQSHLAICERCRELVDALRGENRALSESLNELPEEMMSPVHLSPRRWTWQWEDLTILAAVLALGSIVVPWIDKLSIPSALEWVNPFSTDGLMNMLFNLSYYAAHGGIAMLADYAAVIGGIVLLLGGGALLLRRSRLHVSAFPVLIVLLTLSLPSLALDRRHGEFVTVPANETVDDTLMATGNSVIVEGVVNGDLIVFAQTLEVRGNVKGDVVSLAKRTVVSGTVEGRIFNCSRSMDLDGDLGHSLYNWGQSLRVGHRARVGDGVVAGGDISLEGEVKRSATLYGNVDVSGTVGRDLSLAGGRLGSLVLTDTARVGGNLTARVRQLKDVRIADGASISGKRDIQLRVRTNQLTRPRFYLHQVVWLAAAMLVGWLGLALFPAFFQACTQAVGSGWRSLGIGLGVLAGIPVAVVVLGVTLVGIPISLMLLAVYLAAVYLAKLWVGAFLGRILLKPAGATKRDWLLPLLVGLVILTVVGFIPYLGGLVRLVVVCLGLGAFTWQLYQSSRPVMTS